jgi:hypothetical protein
MNTIKNTNPEYGDSITFTADNMDDAVLEMQNAIHDCGPDFQNVVITDDDFEIIGN